MTLLIADVSEFQGQIDWAAYGATNPVVVVRAAVTYWSQTQGKTIYRADYKWAQNRDGSRAHTQVRGFYQYMDATADPATAARAFMAVVGVLQSGEFVILDIEEGAGDQSARRQTWLDTVHGLNAAEVEWTYSGLFFARNHLPGVRVDWLAAYQGTEPTDSHSLWQYADNQPFAGIGACDGSRFNGTLDQLKALVEAAVPAPAGPASDVPPVFTKPAPAPAPKPAPAPSKGLTVQIIDLRNADRVTVKGPGVKPLQRLLGVTVDGLAGRNTKAALHAYQLHAFGPQGADDIFGQQTAESLLAGK